MSVNELYNPDNQNNINANVYTNNINANSMDISGNLTVEQLQANQSVSVGTTFPNTVLITNGIVSSNGLNVGGLFFTVDQSGNVYADGSVQSLLGFQSPNFIVGDFNLPNQLITINTFPLPAASINLNIPDTGTANASFVLADNVGNLTPNTLIATSLTTNSLTLPAASLGTSTLSTYASVTVASALLQLSFTGPTASPIVVNCGAQRIGNAVTITIPSFSGNVTLINQLFVAVAGSLPNPFRPLSSAVAQVTAINNSADAYGSISIESNGQVALYLVTPPSITPIAFSLGTGGLYNMTTLTYIAT